MSRANWENRVPLLEEIIENYDQNNIITKQKQCSIKSEGYNLKNVNMYGELNQATRSGKNIFNKNNFNELNGSFASGNIVSSNSERIIYFKCEKNTSYAFQKLLGENYKRFSVATTTEIPAVGNSYSDNKNMVSLDSKVYLTSNTAEYIAFWYFFTGSELSKQDVLDSIQIEIGTTSTEYEEYGVSPSPDYPAPINVVGDNINVFNESDFISTQNLTTETYNNISYIKISGLTASQSYNISNLKANAQYTITLTVAMTNGSGFEFKFIYSDNTTSTITYSTANDNLVTYTATSVEGKTVVGLRYMVWNYGIIHIKENSLKIEQGLVATGYTHYNCDGIDYKVNNETTTIELPQGEYLAKLNDAQDYIDENGVINHNVGKVVLDGSENWSSTGNGYFTVLSDAYCLSNTALGSNIPTYLKCNRFPNASISTIYNGTGTGVGLWSVSGVNRLAFYYSGKTMAEFKTWLETNPVEVYYITTVPYDVELDPAEKAKYLTLSTVSGTNNIECSAPVSFEYSKKVSEILNEVKTSYESEVQ